MYQEKKLENERFVGEHTFYKAFSRPDNKITCAKRMFEIEAC